jgi:hypothetical protein
VNGSCIFFCFSSHFSYKILQASDYDDTRLITGENLRRQRSKNLAHLTLKHISLLGVVRVKIKGRKKKAPKNKRVSVPGSSARHFLFDEAAAAEEDEDDDDDEDGPIPEDDPVPEDDEAYNEEGELAERGMSESEYDSDSDDNEENLDVSGGEGEEESGDISEEIVRRAERGAAQADESTFHQELTEALVPSTSAAAAFSKLLDNVEHNYTKNLRKDSNRVPNFRVGWRRRARYKYSFLYSMVVSGSTKRINNCIPKGVAILSNSKTIIMGHVNVMLECLDPRLAEICYMDTDSCIFSFTHENLDDNLLKEKKELWWERNIIADEEGHQSCHGKLKLEGTFKVGLFKALKIYRLFSTANFEKEKKDKTCYTRCKGVNRNIAKMIPNNVFDREALNQVVVHRSCLRPSRTGEMLIAHECKSLAAPFNLKRHVTSDGLHTFPISYLPAPALHHHHHGDLGEIFQHQI